MKTLLGISFTLLTLPTLHAASVIVNWSIVSDPVRRLFDHNGTALSAGTAAAGDGTLLQLGYYDMATMSSPFSGSWVVLASTTMGDDGVEIAGKFATTSSLDSGLFVEPPIGTPLAIRFYDGPSVAASSYFNAVSVTDGTWNFISPTDPAPVLNLVIDKGPATVFEGGLLSDFKTTRPIPEPCAPLLWAMSVSTLWIRQRSKNAT